MTPEQANAWLRLVGAPIVGFAIAMIITVTESWADAPYAAPVVAAFVLGPFIWGKGQGPGLNGNGKSGGKEGK